MKILSVIWKVIVFIAKALLKILLAALWLALEILKIFLIMFGLVFRIFLAFVDAGTV